MSVDQAGPLGEDHSWRSADEALAYVRECFHNATEEDPENFAEMSVWSPEVLADDLYDKADVPMGAPWPRAAGVMDLGDGGYALHPEFIEVCGVVLAEANFNPCAEQILPTCERVEESS